MESLIIGSSAAANADRRFAATYGPRRITAGIIGESGTGKRIMAEELHRLAGVDCPFVHLHASEFTTPDMIKSMLAGHAKGAFTDAITRQLGLLESAPLVFVFLDDVQELPKAAQPFLLVPLDGYSVRGVGMVRPTEQKVRWIIGSQKPFQQLVAEGVMNRDVKARMDGACHTLAPLRDRLEDLDSLVPHLLIRAAREESLRLLGCSSTTMRILRAHRWPDNVRELLRALSVALIEAHAAGSSLIEPVHLPDHITDPGVGRPDKELLVSALRDADWNVARAARALDINIRMMWRYLKEFAIRRPGEEAAGLNGCHATRRPLSRSKQRPDSFIPQQGEHLAG